MESTIHHLLTVWMQFVLDWGYLGVFVMMFFEIRGKITRSALAEL